MNLDLNTLWFVLIAVLWIGYFFLEGFDFGVGMLLPVLSKNENDRRVMINTIGPVWDGNEVWLLTAGGATFAAFPNWYATLFSGAYLALFLILLALIGRGVAFEYRGKVDDPKWRARWDLLITVGSALPALLWGVAFGNIVSGMPIDKNMEFTGNLFTLLNPYALLGGLVTLTLFATHGAVYLALKSHGDVRERANALVGKLGPVTAVIAVMFLVWSEISYTGSPLTYATAALAALALVGGLAANRIRREGGAFILVGATIVLAVVTLFAGLYPRVLPSSFGSAFDLTIYNASSSPYTLGVMSWVALIFTPLVLVYQSWTYWVFRRRVRPDTIPAAAPSPVSVEDRGYALGATLSDRESREGALTSRGGAGQA